MYIRSVASLSREEIVQLTQLVNEANAVRPRIFPRDRLAPDSLETGYAESEALCLGTLDEPVGCVLTQVKEQALWLFLLAVHPNSQGKGYGKLLIEAAATSARDKGVGVLKLDVVDRGSLMDFYRSLGFEEVNRKTCPVGQWGAESVFDLATMQRVL